MALKKVYSATKNNLPSNIVIKQFDYNILGCSQILELIKKVMPKYERAIIKNLKSLSPFICAYDTSTNKIVGVCSLLEKTVNTDVEISRQVEDEKTMILDFLFVNPKYQHLKIGSNLISEAYNYCGENNYSKIQLYCEIEKSLKPTVYDKNDFYKIGVASENNLSNEPYFFIFESTVDKSIRQYGKVLYATIIDALSRDEDYFTYKQKLDDGYIPNEAYNLKNITLNTVKNILHLEQFDYLDLAVMPIINKTKNIIDVNNEMYSMLKSKNVYVKNKTYNSYSSLDDYVSLNKNELKFVYSVINETAKKALNDFIEETYNVKGTR